MTRTRPPTGWPDAPVEKTPRLRAWWVPWLVAAVVAALVIGVGSFFVYGRNTTAASMRTGGGPPQVTGYAAGREVRFIHTEASDPRTARLLTRMTRSPVIPVPSLSQVPPAALGTLYVFVGGAQSGPRGPLGFQADVFDTVPGDAGYTPLRSVVLVTWSPRARPRVLRSAPEVRAAEARGELRLEAPGVVVDVPVVRWPGGHR